MTVEELIRELQRQQKTAQVRVTATRDDGSLIRSREVADVRFNGAEVVIKGASW